MNNNLTESLALKVHSFRLTSETNKKPKKENNLKLPNPNYIPNAKKVKMYYDPRGQVVRTVNPDATEQ